MPPPKDGPHQHQHGDHPASQPGAKTILVTGGAGFIGSHVCEQLLEKGATVRCFDNLVTGNQQNVNHLHSKEAFTFVKDDIRDPAAVQQAIQGVEAIVHLAALGSVPRSIVEPLESEQANLGGFLNVLEAARECGVKRIVYASSSSVYGDSRTLPKKEGDEGHPLSPYAVTKVMNEAYARLYARLFGLEPIGLRFFNIFGERQDPQGAYAAAIPRFIGALLRHEAPTVNGDGLQTRDFTYVENAVQGVLRALEAPPSLAGEVFNIARGEPCNLLDLLRKMQERLARIDPAIARIEPQHGPDRPGDVRDSLADIGKATEHLGYAPRYSLEDGLDRAVAWYAGHWR